MRHHETPGPLESVTRENSARDVHPGHTPAAESLCARPHGAQHGRAGPAPAERAAARVRKQQQHAVVESVRASSTWRDANFAEPVRSISLGAFQKTRLGGRGQTVLSSVD